MGNKREKTVSRKSSRSPGQRTRSRKSAYYHVTHPENVESIRANGLRADAEGRIYVITDPWVADVIARDQVFARTFALFGVSEEGVTGAVEPDLVSELVRGYQRVLVQPLVAPEHITLLGTHTRDWCSPLEWDFLFAERMMGLNREEATAYYAVIHTDRRNGLSCEDMNERIQAILRSAERRRGGPYYIS